MIKSIRSKTWKAFFVVLIISVPFVFGATTYNLLSKGYADTLYCSISDCNLYLGEIWNYTPGGFNFPIAESNTFYNLTGLSVGDLVGFEYFDETQEEGGTKLRALNAGTYLVSFSISFKSNNVGGEYDFFVVKNNDPDNSERHCFAKRDASTSVGNLGVTCTLPLVAYDNISVVIENANNNRDLTIYNTNLNVVRIND